MKIVTISYDYELCWGVWDVVAKDYSESNVANSNNAAQCLIELHREFQIPETWAVVGAAVDYGKSLSERMRSCNRSPKVVTMLERFAEALDFESKYFEIPKEFLHAVERENELFELFDGSRCCREDCMGRRRYVYVHGGGGRRDSARPGENDRDD